MFNRKQVLSGAGNESIFLWGARQTGKSTLLKTHYPNSLWFDLLRSDVYRRFLSAPAQFREAILADDARRLVIVDEIQKIPALLDEIHWLIVNHVEKTAILTPLNGDIDPLQDFIPKNR